LKAKHNHKKKSEVPKWVQHVAYRIYAFEVCMFAEADEYRHRGNTTKRKDYV